MSIEETCSQHTLAACAVCDHYMSLPRELVRGARNFRTDAPTRPHLAGGRRGRKANHQQNKNQTFL